MQKTKVLIVEDEPIVMKICDLILKTNGFDPILAVNGAEGLSVYNERHEEICLVLSDVSMPEMNGIEMVRTLFETHSHPNVIMMSGLGLSDLVPEDLQRLCSVIEKPFTPRGLVKAVNKCLRYEEEHHPLARPASGGHDRLAAPMNEDAVHIEVAVQRLPVVHHVTLESLKAWAKGHSPLW